MVFGYGLLSGVLFIILSGGQIAHIHETGTIPFALHFLSFLINMPFVFYFNPLLIVYGITSLSNYYQYALQHEVYPVV